MTIMGKRLRWRYRADNETGSGCLYELSIHTLDEHMVPQAIQQAESYTYVGFHVISCFVRQTGSSC